MQKSWGTLDFQIVTVPKPWKLQKLYRNIAKTKPASETTYCTITKMKKYDNITDIAIRKVHLTIAETETLNAVQVTTPYF